MPKNLNELNISPQFQGFIKNLSEEAEKPSRMPFFNREKELEAVMETLLRKLKNNLLLVGKPGVGKTALITELASRINRGQVPPFLKNKTIMEVAVNAFFYSKDSVEQLAKDLEKFLSEIRTNRDGIILFLDDMQIPSFAGANKQNQWAPLQNLLKTHIASREFTVIAASIPEDYFKFIKSDDILNANFSTVFVEEPGKDEMIRILEGARVYFENSYNLQISNSLFESIYTLAQRFIPHRAFPDKAIELLDISCSKASLKNSKKLEMDFVFQSISTISKLPIDIVKKDPSTHYRGILDYLKSVSADQILALEEISRILKIAKLDTDINQLRPEGIFLFLGPAGVGKSYVAKKIAEYLFGTEEKLRIINLANFPNAEDIIKLIGGDNPESPGILIREIENHPFSVILFENIEAVHPSILYYLGKVLNKGEIIDSFGNKQFLSRLIFILSLTHLGEQRFESPIGFVADRKDIPEIIVSPKIMNVLDWVDEIIQFAPLAAEHLKQIAVQTIEKMKQELKAKYRCQVQVDPHLIEVLSEDAAKSGKFAHAVTEFVEREIKMKLVDMATKSSKKMNFEVILKNDQVEIKVM